MTTTQPIDSSIREILQRFPRVRLAILFGSCARGTASADSDLDLAVQAAEPLDTATRIQLIGDLAERLGRPVDLVDL
jgi:predicted nucleotidyltransferase